MTVSELIELLQLENPNAEVHFQYNYGDRWNTQAAPSIDEVRTGYVTYSEYHRMNTVVDGDSNEATDLEEVILLV